MFCLIGVNCFFFLWKLTAVTSFSSIVRSVIIFRYCNMHCKFRSVGQLHLKSVVCMMKCSPSLVSRSPFISLFKTQKRETVTSYMSPECYILRTSPPSLLSAPESHIVNVVLSYFSLCAWFGRASSYIIWILASHPPPLFLAAAHCPAMFAVPDLELWISNYRKDYM